MEKKLAIPASEQIDRDLLNKFNDIFSGEDRPIRLKVFRSFIHDIFGPLTTKAIWEIFDEHFEVANQQMRDMRDSMPVRGSAIEISNCLIGCTERSPTNLLIILALFKSCDKDVDQIAPGTRANLDKILNQTE